MSLALLRQPAPVRADDFNDFVHMVCEDCERAACDGIPCDIFANGVVPPEDVWCAVCEDLEQHLTTCPYCGADTS